MLGNELAVEALQNTDKLEWHELEIKLKKALYFYDKTPTFGLLYGSQG